MKKLLIVLAVLALGVGMATAKTMVVPPTTDTDQIGTRVLGQPSTLFLYDNIESGNINGWTHGDYTATTVAHFHVDTYMAYAGTYSWWCGNFAYDADGGYANSWTDFLKVRRRQSPATRSLTSPTA